MTIYVVRQLYREMVGLELTSTFAFQGTRWLADVAPALLPHADRLRLMEVKRRAQQRVDAEARIPDELLYVKGWPTFVPSLEQADLIASVRRQVAAAVGLAAQYIDAASVRARYAELFYAKQAAA